MKKFKSIAYWPENTCPYNITPDRSEDTHDTKEGALGVCWMLRRDGFAGEGKIFPVKTEVKEIE